MAKQTNVDNANFPGDHINNTDYMNDVNAARDYPRELAIDLQSGYEIIYEGLTVEDGTALDSFKVNIGRARDVDGKHIVLSAAEDNIASLDQAGNLNYIAIRNIEETGDNAESKKTSVTYDRSRWDGWKINVSLAMHNPAAPGYWVLLATAQKIGGVWIYDQSTSVRSLEAIPSGNSLFSMSFTYPGALPGVYQFMFRHGINADQHPVPGIFEVKRISVKQSVASASNTNVDIYKNGVSLAAGLGLAQIVQISGGSGLTFLAVRTDELPLLAGPFIFSRDDLIQAKCSNGAGIPPSDLVINIAGEVRRVS